MTREQAVRELEAQIENTDYEVAHLKADGILIEFIESLGYFEVADAYRKVGKYYA